MEAQQGTRWGSPKPILWSLHPHAAADRQSRPWGFSRGLRAVQPAPREHHSAYALVLGAAGVTGGHAAQHEGCLATPCPARSPPSPTALGPSGLSTHRCPPGPRGGHKAQALRSGPQYIVNGTGATHQQSSRENQTETQAERSKWLSGPRGGRSSEAPGGGVGDTPPAPRDSGLDPSHSFPELSRSGTAQATRRTPPSHKTLTSCRAARTPGQHPPGPRRRTL